ncbi:hypothetical protein ACJMK2_037490 [Sinanodonta woodiana]|uniref:JNK1/MAPK8-associated membrane protein n=1 Tax=Sinanodonta woodiana TaxID=1069815 RepID=A0ABD3WMD1_SINWO
MENKTLWSIIVTILGSVSFAEVISKPSKCPGLYCGRIDKGQGEYTDCGACPRGYQPDNESLCQKCDSAPAFYDWLYLGFMAMLSLILHWFFIDYTNNRKRSLVVLHISALVETGLAVLLTLLLSEPMGSLHMRSCPVTKLEDWYTMLYNPSPNYTTTLYCTQEIVYPLYTMVMIYYAFSLLMLMLIRPLVSVNFVESRGTKSMYAALYFLPILIVLQAVFGGLLYYAFPYIVIVLSLITSAVKMVYSPDQASFKSLIIDNLTNVRNLTVLAGHWLLHAYGIVSLTELTEPSFHGPLIALVPFPVIFYILTVRFTDPDNLDRVV